METILEINGKGMMVGTKTLAEKLAEAMDNAGGVNKKGKNEAQGYKYVKAADVMKEFRHELFSRGIIIIPDELEYTERNIQTGFGDKVRNATEGRITILYTITDGIEKIPVKCFGIARDYSDKAIYKAKTGAQKYLLRQLGLMPDEADDPETTHIEEVNEDEHLAKLEPKLKAQERIGHVRANTFMESAKKHNKTISQIITFLGELNGYIQADDLTNADWDKAMKWATSPVNDLTAIGKASVSHAQKLRERSNREQYIGTPEEVDPRMEHP